ncbi:autotransporter assembly complex protein TamA [Paracoccus zhejiangensis]|uniref:Outer membrane protein assembly factor n=1 Tax=Paracoccus zhejiangensis TaxID=1077935 RepID=A0A2H5F0R4_9RHOB|nr:autotransporter assembly complex family protein [Paracoccus zhejiangensis]AUH65123.1 outer membrane protein assembly factor [Paracoccus zhejiangensis]
MGLLRAAVIAATALAAPALVMAQSSSPFSGLFGGGSEADGPVKLDVQVSGEDDGLSAKVKNTSLISAALSEGRTTGQDVLAAARADYARILGLMYDEGYYSTIIYITLDGVEAAEIAPLDAPQMVTNVAIRLETGPRFTFSRAAIDPLAPETEIPEGYAVGETGGTGVIKSAAVAGVDGWRNAGHAKADVGGQNIVADHNQNTVDSQIALAPGPTVTFGKLNITGNQRMNLRRLYKIAGFPEGTRFDPEEIEDVRKRLRRTGVFSAITLEEAETLGPGGTMDVNLTVVEQKPRRIGAGFEISNTDGAMVSAYWMHRNLLGGGERLRIDGEVSDISSDTSGLDGEFKLRIDRPATITADTTAYFETTVEQKREEEYDSDTGTVSFGLNHIFSDRLTADAAIEYSKSRVRDDNGTSHFEVIAFPMNVEWDRRDEPTDAKRGYWLSGDLVPFYGLEETGSGAQIEGEGRAYYSFGTDDRFTLAGRARIGTIVGSDIEDTPRDYLFYSGGGSSVRGQPYESLGVEVIPGPDGPIETGGMSLANLSAEIRYQLREKIGLVAFADFGQVWTEGTFGGDSGNHSGAGVGVRYATPIGPLRFDIAGPVSGETGNGVQLYLGLGQAF